MADVVLRNPNAIVLRREPVKSKVLLTQAAILVLNYVAFCLTVNYIKPSIVDWVNFEDKIFFGALLCFGFGQFVVVGYLLDTVIPRIANNRFIKDVIFSLTGTTMRTGFAPLITFILLTYTVRVNLLLSVFFEGMQVHEDFLKVYGGIGVIVFLLSSMAIGNIFYYILVHNNALLFRGESVMMMIRRGRLTNE